MHLRRLPTKRLVSVPDSFAPVRILLTSMAIDLTILAIPFCVQAILETRNSGINAVEPGIHGGKVGIQIGMDRAPAQASNGNDQAR
mmetsp:Transcript_14347/g.26071  ORF Transcript_14347/g.26071 Transcript_14347/m.26071 type:complete len:86 (+) Transcript_14347:292-549(+)